MSSSSGFLLSREHTCSYTAWSFLDSFHWNWQLYGQLVSLPQTWLWAHLWCGFNLLHLVQRWGFEAVRWLELQDVDRSTRLVVLGLATVKQYSPPQAQEVPVRTQIHLRKFLIYQKRCPSFCHPSSCRLIDQCQNRSHPHWMQNRRFVPDASLAE